MSVAKRWYAFFIAAGLLVVVGVGLLEPAPGYMDADYYYAGAFRLAGGEGFTQPFLWNYLDDVRGLPAPSHTFWMPLVSVLSAAGYALFHTFTGARAALWLLAGAVPALTVYLGWRLHGKQDLAVAGGFLALFPAFYTAYLPSIDAFGVYMLLGSAFLLAAGVEPAGRGRRAFALGLLAGLMHMTRADGILWLAGGLVWLAFEGWQRRKEGLSRLILHLLLCLGGYALVCAPWYFRNLAEFGRLMPPGSSRALWLTQYEDLYIYPASSLTPARWLAGGLGHILGGWWEAFKTNLQTTAGVQGSAALGPFILLGLYRLRKTAGVRFALWMWAATFLAFTLVFPYQGINGSFFHSGAAFQPLFWAAAPVGAAAVVNWAAQKRAWQRGAQVLRFVEVLLVGVCFLLTAGLTYQKIAGGEETPAWGSGLEGYRQLEGELIRLGAQPGDRVMVNNPPGYFLASGRESVVIPFGDETMLKAAANAFDARYLLLDANNSGHLSRLFLTPADYPGLHLLADKGSTRIYEFTSEQP